MESNHGQIIDNERQNTLGWGGNLVILTQDKFNDVVRKKKSERSPSCVRMYREEKSKYQSSQNESNNVYEKI